MFIERAYAKREGLSNRDLGRFRARFVDQVQRYEDAIRVTRGKKWKSTDSRSLLASARRSPMLMRLWQHVGATAKRQPRPKLAVGYLRSSIHWWQASAAPRTEGNFDRAAAAIVHHQAVSPVHFCDEGIGAVGPIRVYGTGPVQIIGHSRAAWSREHASMWGL
jgi:hypothetical protein